MLRHYEQSIEINAAPDHVWPVIAEVTRWAEWTPSISRIVPLMPGPLGVGSRARVHQPKLPPAIWRVTEWNPGHNFTWCSKALGVCVMARHEVEAAGRNSRVKLSLDYEGPLGGWVAKLLHRFNVSCLEQEANGLKVRCETLAPRIWLTEAGRPWNQSTPDENQPPSEHSPVSPAPPSSPTTWPVSEIS